MMTPDQEHQVKMLRALSALGTAYIDNTTHCPGCEMLTHTMLPTLGLARWIEGESIQDAMPELTPSQRESLLTGLCDRCYPDDLADTGYDLAHPEDFEDVSIEVQAARWVESEDAISEPHQA